MFAELEACLWSYTLLAFIKYDNYHYYYVIECAIVLLCSMFIEHLIY